MFSYRNQLFIASIATLMIALLLTITSLVSFVPLLIFLCILLIAISTITDAIIHFIFFRQQEAIVQFMRGTLLTILFFIIVVHYFLQRF